MSRNDEERDDRDGVVPFPAPPGRRRPDPSDPADVGGAGDLPGPWPVRVHVSEADRSELLNRIVGG